MLYVCVESFFKQAEHMPRLTREQEQVLAQKAAQGDADARKQWLSGYLPLIATRIRKAPPRIRTLHTVYACLTVLEKAAAAHRAEDTIDTFRHRVNRALRQTLVRCMAEV